ncbi:methylesterase 18-like isoform X3 [Humulus lupulus]|uniref:methylesterase 18-like isoform X3 n=1 Tax=Humulus lupulus TaxID=3486 RepID=UPI002B4028E5|nr:methylesterase 18-like isoform X3 [Humulus lupulus]
MASEESGSKQLHFVLVHGAGHGGWCWYKIRILLEDAGYKVTCIDLKCSGIDPTDYNTIFTFADYNEPLTTFISNLPSDEKIILVGHSAGGRNVTDALNQFPQKIHMVIYVTAMMVNLPFNFKTTASQHNLVRAIPGENFSYDFIKGIKGLPFPTGITVKPELQNQVLYNLSPIEDYTMASMLLRPTPVWSLLDLNFAEAVEGADNVPRVYIKTLKDELCNPMMQQLMIKMWPPTHVFTIESDHSPFFSKPDQLFSHFVEAVSSIKIK